MAPSRAMGIDFDEVNVREDVEGREELIRGFAPPRLQPLLGLLRAR